MNPNECFFFQPTDYTSSATVCKWCGREKYQHKSEQKQLIIDIMNDDAKDGLYKQQTAVEWLIDQIKNDQNQKALSAKEWLGVIKQAKQMEKEQIMFDYSMGVRDAILDHNKIDCQKHYIETYGKL